MNEWITRRKRSIEQIAELVVDGMLKVLRWEPGLLESFIQGTGFSARMYPSCVIRSSRASGPG